LGYVISGIAGGQIYANTLFDVSWLGVDGVKDITLGQLFMMMVASINFLMAAQFVWGIIQSRFKPWPKQTENVELFSLLSQYFGFWIWTAVWYSFSLIGSDPIRDPKVKVINQESAKFTSENTSSHFFHFVWWWLYITVCTHWIISLQACHVSLQKFSIWNRQLVMTIGLITMCHCIDAIWGDVNAKAWLVVITIAA